MKRFLLGALAALACAAAHAATSSTVSGTVKWSPPTTDVSGNPVVVTSYNIYAGTTTTTCSSSTPLTKVASTAPGVTTFTETGIVPGTTVCVAVTAVNSAGFPSPESAMSNLASYTPALPTPPATTPNPPTNVTITVIVTPTT